MRIAGRQPGSASNRAACPAAVAPTNTVVDSKSTQCMSDLCCPSDTDRECSPLSRLDAQREQPRQGGAMRRAATVTGILLGACCFCAALLALEARQSTVVPAQHSGPADSLRHEQLRRLQQQSGGGVTVTDARILVVPRFPCQLVDANETQCMASVDAASSEPCIKKAMTGAPSRFDGTRCLLAETV